MESILSIARIPIKVDIENNLATVIKLFKNFDRAKVRNSELKIVVRRAEKNLVQLSPNQKSLLIAGKNIDKLSDPFNLVGILQATFRFAGLHSCKKKIFLIHGSASILNGKGVCFADDGGNVGKTISAIECSLTSNKFVGDEFCFLDLKNKSIFSYSFIPLHIREEVKRHLEKKHRNRAAHIVSPKTKAGYFILPGKLFKVYPSVKINDFAFVHFDKRINCQKLNKEEGKEVLKVSLTAHILKLMYPQLDRMKFAESSDSEKAIGYSEKSINKTIKKIISQKDINDIIKLINCYKISISDPCDLMPVLSSIK